MTRRNLLACSAILAGTALIHSADPDVYAAKTTRPPIIIRVPADQPTIQAAIDVSISGDTILVADGTFTGTGNRDISFRGKEITVRSENGPFSTIIDPQHFGRGFSFRNYETNKAKLIGFTIQNGVSTSGGGGIECVSASPVISRCIMRNNRAGSGGGVYFSGGSPTITNCWVVDNDSTFAPEVGGGISCQGSAATIRNCTIAGNVATSDGGGVYAISSTSNVSITSTILFGNGTQDGRLPDQLSIVSFAQVSVSYSDVQGGQADVDVSSNSTLTWGLGNLDADPAFENTTTGDFHLADQSPCLERGDPTFVPPANGTDIDGDPRLFGSFVDVGGDEFASCDPIFRQYFPPSGPFVIPDNNSTGLLLTVNVPDFGFGHAPTGFSTVGFFLDVNHPHPDDLLVTLYPPGCGPGDSCGITFCATGCGSPFPFLFVTGAFFEGTPIHGDWTLQLVDRQAGNVGTLNAWRLDVNFSMCP